MILGEIARKISDVREMLMYSRSAVDILSVWETEPEIVNSLFDKRKVLKLVEEGRESLEAGLDAERRILMRENTERLNKYREASKIWASHWPRIQERISSLKLKEAHRVILEEADKYLPKVVL